MLISHRNPSYDAKNPQPQSDHEQTPHRPTLKDKVRFQNRDQQGETEPSQLGGDLNLMVKRNVGPGTATTEGY